MNFLIELPLPQPVPEGSLVSRARDCWVTQHSDVRTPSHA